MEQTCSTNLKAGAGIGRILLPMDYFVITKPSALCITGKNVGNRELNSEVPGHAAKLVEEEFGAPTCSACRPQALNTRGRPLNFTPLARAASGEKLILALKKGWRNHGIRSGTDLGRHCL